MTDDDPITANPELVAAIAIRAFARAKDAAIRENDRKGVPSYGGKTAGSLCGNRRLNRHFPDRLGRHPEPCCSVASPSIGAHGRE